ncbi:MULTISPECIES: hypothetical protein [unclassified Streptomyces]|uniref:hypothetical protein n=1 Tax=unclassified Streptomyces TaxID=2593676 RepID=UPI000381C6A3|nr:hypothetical protein [Streptomyces sp. HmicA12]
MTSYRYIGPADLLGTVRSGAEGRVVRSADDLVTSDEPFTYVVGLDGLLRLAP